MFAAGCGSGDGSASAASHAELTSCASRFNAERAAVGGTHAYVEHQTQRALVTVVEHEGSETCAVVFAVSEQDSEFGTVGELATLRGWLPMQFAGGDAEALQRRAAAEANATLAPDGTLTLR